MSSPSTRILGLSELATLAGVSRGTLAAWRSRGHVPAPDWTLDCGPVWKWTTVARWCQQVRKRREAGQNVVGQTTHGGN